MCSWFKNKNILLLNLAFLMIFSFILFLFPTVIDPDIYYHLKMTGLYQNQGLSAIHQLPWFQFTSWGQFPADLSLGYHLLLYPLLLILPPLLAAKVLTLILLLIFINFFLFLLKKESIHWPYLWLTLLLTAAPAFLFRLFLLRPFLLSIILSLMILYAVHYKKYWLIIFSTLIYALGYAGWWQIFVIIFIYLMMEWLILKKANLKYLIYSFLPLTFVFLLRPDAPNILILNFQQIFGLLYSNLTSSQVNVGVEQSAMSLKFFLENIIIFGIWLIGILISSQIFKKISNSSLKILLATLIIISTLYGLWTIESIRFIEYFAPFAVLLTAYSWTLFNNSPKNPELQKLFDNLNVYLKKPVIKILLTFAAMALIFTPVKQLLSSFKYAYPVNRYQETAEWLKNNTPAKSIVFHASWDSFPRLFFYNDHNYYIVGLDPTFMYLYNKNLYWLWRNITEKTIACTAPINKVDLADLSDSGCTADQQTPLFIAQTIKSQFNSEYIWINDYCYYQDFKKFLEKNPEYFEKKIETADSSVFRIIK